MSLILICNFFHFRSYGCGSSFPLRALPTFCKLFPVCAGSSLLNETSCGGSALRPLNFNIPFPPSGFDSGNRNIFFFRMMTITVSVSRREAPSPRAAVVRRAGEPASNKSASRSHSSGPIYRPKDRRIKVRLEFMGGCR